MTTSKLSGIVSPAFYDVHRQIRMGRIDEAVLEGGRGSTKSSFASVELVLLLIRHPDCHAVVMRQVANTLRTSVYAQICWAVTALGLTQKFKCTVSPMECTYLPTGQKIMF
ncbi:phage terminase large subunit, partial [Hydrogeniiclostridium mannosilyticum]